MKIDLCLTNTRYRIFAFGRAVSFDVRANWHITKLIVKKMGRVWTPGCFFDNWIFTRDIRVLLTVTFHFTRLRDIRLYTRGRRRFNFAVVKYKKCFICCWKKKKNNSFGALLFVFAKIVVHCNTLKNISSMIKYKFYRILTNVTPGPKAVACPGIFNGRPCSKL